MRGALSFPALGWSAGGLISPCSLQPEAHPVGRVPVRQVGQRAACSQGPGWGGSAASLDKVWGSLTVPGFGSTLP